jgi:hypothetical protein
MAADESRFAASGKKWSQVSFLEGLQTELKKVEWAFANPQEVMAQAADFVARDQPKMWLREFERCSAKVNAGCGAPDPAAAAADEFVVGARSIKPMRVPYLVDNSALQSDEKVLSYCFTKTLWDKVPADFGAPWGSTVNGVDEGDGWLRVGRRYLPMEIGGAPVLSRADYAEEADETEDACTERPGALQPQATTAAAPGTLPDLIDVGRPDLIDLAESRVPQTGLGPADSQA